MTDTKKHVPLQEDVSNVKEQELAVLNSRAKVPVDSDEENAEALVRQQTKHIKDKLYGEGNGHVSNRRLRAYDDDLSYDDEDDETEHVDSADADNTFLNTEGDLVQNKPNPRFKNYSEVFKNLLKQNNVPTMYPICSMIITYDSTKAITVTKRDDKEYYVKQYDLETYLMTFEERIGGRPEQYIKLKEVEQSSDGKKYAVTYNDDGVFYLRTFGKETRKPEEILKEELNINKLLGINNHTMCNQTFPDPFITCSFVTDDLIFINLFLNAELKHIHFIYDLKNRSIKGKIQEKIMVCTEKNFPYKSFYNEEKNEIYSFYRQGQAFIIDADDCFKYSYDRMTEMDLGQMYLVYNTALIARSSSDILFFKIEKDEEGVRQWKQYKILEVRGFIYYIKGNVRIQITTDDKIYFYLIDKDTFEPIFENVMSNYMACNQMMFGSKVRYCVTYKTNQKSFDIYRRKYQHDFKVQISNENLEGSIGLELSTMDCFLVAKIDKVSMYDSNNFGDYHKYKHKEISNVKGEDNQDIKKLLGKQIADDMKQTNADLEENRKRNLIPITLMAADTREPNQVIAMQKSPDEQYLAIISGKILIMNEQQTNQLFVFKRVPYVHVPSINEPEGKDTFELHKRIVLREIPIFKKVCMNYHFKLSSTGIMDTIIFCKQDCIFELNFTKEGDEMITQVYKFKQPLNRQPLFFQPNSDQKIFMIASPEDGLYLNIRDDQKPIEHDINNAEQIASIKDILYDVEDKQYYILSNRYQEKLGFFILRICEKEQTKTKFLIKWKNKLDIGDPNMVILRNKGTRLKELIVSYKTIFMNTYNVICMDISIESDQLIIFRHESFQLWESECMGLLLTKNKDFIHLNKEGIHVLSLGSIEKRPVKDRQKVDKMIHSLESCNFLKVDKSNYLVFECAKTGRRVVSIEQEYMKGGQQDQGDEETSFTNLLNVKLFEITLRELLLFNSLYVCKTLSEIIDIVNDQPKPEVFYKSFLELDGSNMTSILSFDSRSMAYLLKDEFAQYFSSEFPLFYRNKIQKGPSKDNKYFYRSAIDSALRNNQVRAVQEIISYIVKYQNNFVSSFLFLKNFPNLLEKGITVKPLLDSQVFNYEFDLDEWPSTHNNNEEYLRPYNENLFMLRKHYETVFPEQKFRPIGELRKLGVKLTSNKVYKIKYTLNMLPQIGVYMDKQIDPYTEKVTQEIKNGDINLLSQCAETETELAMFESEPLKDLVKFKWSAYGFRFHLFGASIHFIYIILLFLYTDKVYIQGNKVETNIDNTAGTTTGDGLRLLQYALPNSRNLKVSASGAGGPGIEVNQEDVIKAQENQIVEKGEIGDNVFAYFLLLAIVYPFLYECVQMYQNGVLDYLMDLGNYIDIAYILGSIVMTFVHITHTPYIFLSKLLMALIVTLAIRRTFNFLRIFSLLSPIVTMLNNVIWQLRIFLTFYFILILLFSLMYGVLGIGNHNLKGKFQTEHTEMVNGVLTLKGDAPGIEYEQVGLFFGNFLQTMRISLGDFAAIAAADFLTQQENYLFWFIWLLTAILTCIIFLNFIVAEASASYNEVSEQLENYIQQQKAELCAEAEELIPNRFKKANRYPKFVLIRKIET